MIGRILVIATLCACNGSKTPSKEAPVPSGSGAEEPTFTGKLKPGCELITVDEVATISGVKVTAEPDVMPEHSTVCRYVHDRDTVLVLRVEAQYASNIGSVWDANRADSFESTNPPVSVAGLGDEAVYAEFKNGYGSNLLVRRGAFTVLFGGNQRRNAYVAMAKLVIPRL